MTQTTNMPTSMRMAEARAPRVSANKVPTAFTSPVTRVTRSPLCRRAWKASDNRCSWA